MADITTGQDVDLLTLPAGNLGQQNMAESLSVVPADDITDATYIGDIKFGEALPDTAAGDFAAMVVDLAAIEALLITIDSDTGNILSDTTAILSDTALMVTDLAAIEALLITIDSDTGNILADTTAILADTAAMVIDLAAIEVTQDTIAGAIYAEDVGSSPADPGMAVMAVRTDTIVAGGGTGTDGDYTPLRTDSYGAVHTSNIPFQADQSINPLHNEQESVGTSAVPITTSSVKLAWGFVKAATDNTDMIYIGTAGTPPTTSTGYGLLPGEELPISGDTHEWEAISGSTGQKVYVIGVKIV